MSLLLIGLLKCGKNDSTEKIYHSEMPRKKILPYVNNDQSLKDSLLISKALIDHHLPFLPLERNHVTRCIKNAIQNHPSAPKAKKPIRCTLIDWIFWLGL